MFEAGVEEWGKHDAGQTRRGAGLDAVAIGVKIGSRSTNSTAHMIPRKLKRRRR
jgi:hypothetical protein